MRLVFISLSFLLSITLYSQTIQWTAFEHLNDSLKANPKQVIIKIETTWCGYCRLMDKKVFHHKLFAKKVKGDYYFVRLNAEAKEAIVFRNQLFQSNDKQEGKHELAIALNGENTSLTFPTIIVLNSNLEIKQRLNGYLNRHNFLLWLGK